MNPLVWLAIPILVTIGAAAIVPFTHRRRQRVLTDQQRSAVLAQHLSPETT